MSAAGNDTAPLRSAPLRSARLGLAAAGLQLLGITRSILISPPMTYLLVAAVLNKDLTGRIENAKLETAHADT
jgi:hypothetical protein